MDAAKLKEIRNAEVQAEKLLSSVEEEALEIVRNARTKAQQLMDEAKISVRKTEEGLMAQFQKQGQEQASSILSSLDKDLAQLDSKAQAGQKKAVDYVLSEMKVFYGNR